MIDVYTNIDDCNPDEKRKALNMFDDMIADMISNEKLEPIPTGLFIRWRRLGPFLVFITRLYFAAPQNVRLKSSHYFIMKIPKKRGLQQLAFNHSSDIDCGIFIRICRICTNRQYSFLVNDTSPSSDYPLRFRKNLVDEISHGKPFYHNYK